MPEETTYTVLDQFKDELAFLGVCPECLGKIDFSRYICVKCGVDYCGLLEDSDDDEPL